MRPRFPLWLLVMIVVLAFGGLLAACAPMPPMMFSQPGTPAAGQPEAAAQLPTDTPVKATAVPTKEPTATPTKVRATATPTAEPTATRVAPTATRVRPTATPTRVRPTPTAKAPTWPQTIVVTEADIEAGAASAASEGITLQGLTVDLEQDKMTVSVDSARYGFITLRDLAIEGHVTVANGVVKFHTDRITPRNLATAAIPGLIDQFLSQALAQWYVEDVQIEPGQITISVRPR